MQHIDTISQQLRMLATSFVKSVAQARQLSVFLCGRQAAAIGRDYRHHVKRFLSSRLCCRPFLGEEIPELLQPKISRDHLSIETAAATKADLIVVFLGSPGTVAELTAFSLSADINPKVIVFNDRMYKSSQSFLTKGPLRLLKNKDALVYYNSADQVPTSRVLRHLDLAVARRLYSECAVSTTEGASLSFAEFQTLSSIYAMFPVSIETLVKQAPISNRLVREGLRGLHEHSLIRLEERMYFPTKPIKDLQVDAKIAADVMAVRLSMLADGMLDRDRRRDYSMLVT